MEKLIKIRNLKKYFVVGYKNLLRTKPIYLKAVDNISFDINKGETLGLVGESGCGKSTLARTIIRIHDPTDGDILIGDKNYAKLKHEELIKERRNIQMIFQDPYASLNPRMTVGDIVAEPLIIYKKLRLIDMTKNQIKKRVQELFEIVGLSRTHINRYPHEFSGGQRQRIGIARALALNPKIILCDEPVSALDVSIQSQVLNLLINLQKEFGLTYLFISHNLSVVRHISNRIAVMYLGRIVEISDYEEIYKNPLHPYTIALLSAVPIPNPRKEKERKRIILEGDVPSADREFKGCRFYDRCFKRMNKCMDQAPELKEVKNGHFVECFLYE
ncbi:MAG: ATP-binding cassette domain-containing protein [Spirochaetes bacterium]|nr:ATP-binding cassette domain-containing protein [Spirochaetota bacterium]